MSRNVRVFNRHSSQPTNRFKVLFVLKPKSILYLYVDFISVGNKVAYEAASHKVIQAINNVVKNIAVEASIGFIDSVIPAFLSHEMYSGNPYADGFDHPENLLHPNLKGYAKTGQVVAAYIKSQ